MMKCDFLLPTRATEIGMLVFAPFILLIKFASSDLESKSAIALAILSTRYVLAVTPDFAVAVAKIRGPKVGST